MRELVSKDMKAISGGLIIGPFVYPLGVVIAAAQMTKEAKKEAATSESSGG